MYRCKRAIVIHRSVNLERCHPPGVALDAVVGEGRTVTFPGYWVGVVCQVDFTLLGLKVFTFNGSITNVKICLR